ncbi:MAG: sigma-70 family RNA polymerase sigma factor [Sphingomonadales bacterium]
MDDLKWMIARQLPALRRYAQALAGDRDRADDLVQDCLERALKKRHLWRRKGPLRSWLFRILHNVHVDQQRSPKGRELPLREADAVLRQRPDQESGLHCQDIGKAMAQLPDEQRKVLLLVALENFSYDEVADILDTPIGTVRSRLSRGRQALRVMGVGLHQEPKLRSVK